MKTFDIDKIVRLIEFHNKLVKEFGVPWGDIQIQLDDGYVGELYAVDWDCQKGTVVLELSDKGFIWSYVNITGEGHGTLTEEWSDYNNLAISIKDCM
jgi:hypothetical protein